MTAIPASILNKLVADGASEVARAQFAYYWNEFLAGQVPGGTGGKIPATEIEPCTEEDLLLYEDLPRSTGEEQGKIAVLKLNGGLGTSMGLRKAKSLLEIKAANANHPSLTFLDIIARQTLASGLPLILMNSYNTRRDTMDFLKQQYPELFAQDLVSDFVQHRFPRLVRTDSGYAPVKIDGDSGAEWNPPGHGDLYSCLYEPQANGKSLLDQLLDRGIEILFVSNSDNLAALPEPAIAAHMCRQGENCPVLVEFRRRSENERKGGHPALKDGRLILREVAQCPADEMADFQDVKKYRFFNSNNIWLNLRELKRQLAANGGFLRLPVFPNVKTVAGQEVVQLETAMGSAVNTFPNGQALLVPRRRYSSVKLMSNYLLARSDVYEIDPQTWAMTVAADLECSPVVTLPESCKTIEDLQHYFPEGIPSLRNCRRLTITAPCVCPADMKLEGDVILPKRDS